MPTGISCYGSCKALICAADVCTLVCLVDWGRGAGGDKVLQPLVVEEVYVPSREIKHTSRVKVLQATNS